VGVVEVAQHGVERDAAAGDVTDRRGRRQAAACNRRGENLGHLSVQLEGHLAAHPYFAPGGGSSSVLKSGVSALDLAMKAARGVVERRRRLRPGGDGLAGQGEELLTNRASDLGQPKARRL
jgi:hypothetical protein